ncbi:uncharacterized protein LOC128230932 [Mya arenaria]|uniref:uncharacterized protein LOC128230932 n=1 Tax=Mya arenaria TaxID=6604 RepID=UPI0022E5319B|nr:uncharacterized protein LOC128230932 [Mya arenaria]
MLFRLLDEDEDSDRNRSATERSYLPSACLGFNCTGRADGVYEEGCQTATRCVNQTASHLTCMLPKVINSATWLCDSALNVNTPCGTFRDCSIRDDGGFPDLETHCAWYFMCSYGIFYGHHKCAGGLVWNSVLQTCDFPGNTLPPCGTKP